MNRKNKYKDLDRFKETKRRQQERYNYKNGAYKWRTRWNEEDEQRVLAHDIPDSELSKEIKHSIASIQTRRSELKKETE